MPEIASPGITWTVVVVVEIATRHHSKRSDGAERPRLRAAKFVLVVAISNYFAFEALRQIELMGEHVSRVDRIVFTVALVIVTVARIIAPTGIVEHTGRPFSTTKCELGSCGLSREYRTPTTAVVEPTPLSRAVVERFEPAALGRVNEGPFDVNERRAAADRSCFAY